MRTIALRAICGRCCRCPRVLFTVQHPAPKLTAKSKDQMAALEFVNVVLNAAADSSLLKVEVTRLDGFLPWKECRKGSIGSV